MFGSSDNKDEIICQIQLHSSFEKSIIERAKENVKDSSDRLTILWLHIDLVFTLYILCTLPLAKIR